MPAVYDVDMIGAKIAGIPVVASVENVYNEEEHIWFHADDYGVTPEQSKRILDCYKQGVLNSISVLPNSPLLVSNISFPDIRLPG